MPFQLPLSLNFGTMPQTGQGYTPQTMADRLGSNAKLFSEQQMALFTAGSTAPTSNIGPWLKNDQTWYVWDSVSGSYVPEVLESLSLRYIIANAAPDHTKYDVWYQVDGSGVPMGIFTWYSGAWVDQYAAIAAANALNYASRVNYCMRATNAIPQLAIPTDGTDTKVVMPVVVFDPDTAWNPVTSRYTAAVDGIYEICIYSQVDNNTGDAANMFVGFDIYLNGGPWAGVGTGSAVAIANPPGSRWFPGFTTTVPLSATQFIELYILAVDGTGTGNVTLATVGFSMRLIREL